MSTAQMEAKTKKNGKALTKPNPGGISVGETVRLALGELNMAPYNPRVMTAEKMRALKASLRKHGMVLNLVVQRHSEEYDLPLVLIGGHQRVTAMREICAEEGWPEPDKLPCIIIDVDDATAKQLNVSLNNVEGEFDPYKLGAMFADIYPAMTADDVLATGFVVEQIEEVRKLALPVDDQILAVEDEIGGLGEFAKSITLSVEFDTVEQRDEAKAFLKRLSEETKKKPGTVMYAAVRAYASTRPEKKKKLKS